MLCLYNRYVLHPFCSFSCGLNGEPVYHSYLCVRVGIFVMPFTPQKLSRASLYASEELAAVSGSVFSHVPC